MVIVLPLVMAALFVLTRQALASGGLAPAVFGAFGSSPVSVFVYISGFTCTFLSYLGSMNATLITSSVHVHRKMMLRALHQAVRNSCTIHSHDICVPYQLNGAHDDALADHSARNGSRSTNAVEIAVPIIQLNSVGNIQAYIATRRVLLLFIHFVSDFFNIQAMIIMFVVLAAMVVTIILVLVTGPPYDLPALRIYAAISGFVDVLLYGGSFTIRAAGAAGMKSIDFSENP
jgi:hypothetical protein